MERVGETKRLVGFSCGNLYVMTPSIAFKVKFSIILKNFSF